MRYAEIDQNLVDAYRHSEDYSFLISPIQIVEDENSKGVIVRQWGKQLSSLSEA